MPKVSVIVPVYNVENYLKRCLDSLINQTLQDIEIICINDASTDGSLAVLQEYALNDKRIKIIDLPQNKGVSAARNLGINNAEGKYIAFLDSDDWWEHETAECTLNKIQENDSDILIFCSNFYDNDKITVNNEQLKSLSEMSKQNRITTYKSNIVHYAWDKLYKAEFIKNNSIKFIEKISYAEDVIFSIECLSHKPKMISFPKCLYNYRINREGSAMADYSNLVANQIKAFKTMLDCNFFITSTDKFKLFCINTMLGGILHFYVLSSQKKFSLNDFLEIRKLAPYLRSKIPEELLKDIVQYTVLSNLASANLKSGVSCLKTKVN